LLCIEFVILLIEEKVMSYVTVSEGHGYPLVILGGKQPKAPSTIHLDCIMSSRLCFVIN
jgi:hypothetical protein